MVDGLSNWYVRRSRDRYWASEIDSQDKYDAYWTLYETLTEVTKLIAPFVPFLAETFWKRLTEPFAGKALKSVHLCDYPSSNPARIDRDLSDSMKLLREIASLGRAARAEAKLKVRLPLSRVEVVLTDDAKIGWLKNHDELVREELNVKTVEYTTDGDEYVQYIGRSQLQATRPQSWQADTGSQKAAWRSRREYDCCSRLQTTGKITIDLPAGPLDLDGDDVEIRLQAREGWAAAQGSGCVVVLNTEVTDALRREGTAKDLIRTIQNQRKEIACEYTDRIEIGIVTDSDEVKLAIKEHQDTIRGETLADRLIAKPIENCDGVETDAGTVYVRKVQS